jgi:hypothetical protein
VRKPDGGTGPETRRRRPQEGLFHAQVAGDAEAMPCVWNATSQPPAHRLTDLPPITLRDLRHVAATLTHGGGGDIHTVKETLRHSTITLTSHTYTSLLPELDREIAEKAAKLIPRSRPAVAEPFAPTAFDPQATGASAYASHGD